MRGPLQISFPVCTQSSTGNWLVANSPMPRPVILGEEHYPILTGAAPERPPFVTKQLGDSISLVI